jgi:hypothetical protein
MSVMLTLFAAMRPDSLSPIAGDNLLLNTNPTASRAPGRASIGFQAFGSACRALAAYQRVPAMCAWRAALGRQHRTNAAVMYRLFTPIARDLVRCGHRRDGRRFDIDSS